MSKETNTSNTSNKCWGCGEPVDSRRWDIGKRTCMGCGEVDARSVKHTIVPMPKSNYIVVSDLSLLVGLNNSHKGVTK